jgi:hypothetical protein
VLSLSDIVTDLLPNPFVVSPSPPRGKKAAAVNYGEGFELEPKALEAKEMHARRKLQAFWQLLVTGFEVVRFSIGKRAKHYVLWLALDAKLYLGSTKRDRKSAKYMHLGDILRIQKGNDAQSFTKSQSWRETRGKDHLTFSIHGKHGKEDRIFAIQVLQTSVRNILVENFELLLKMIKSDVDGEFPFVARRVVAQQYAATGELLTLRQVEDILLREEEERKQGGGNTLPREYYQRDSSDDDNSSDDEDICEEKIDQRNILG